MNGDKLKNGENVFVSVYKLSVLSKQQNHYCFGIFKHECLSCKNVTTVMSCGVQALACVQIP